VSFAVVVIDRSVVGTEKGRMEVLEGHQHDLCGPVRSSCARLQRSRSEAERERLMGREREADGQEEGGEHRVKANRGRVVVVVVVRW
jgi:hypothetical protein